LQHQVVERRKPPDNLGAYISICDYVTEQHVADDGTPHQSAAVIASTQKGAHQNRARVRPGKYVQVRLPSLDNRTGVELQQKRQRYGTLEGAEVHRDQFERAAKSAKFKQFNLQAES
jgi:hypothetical protein